MTIHIILFFRKISTAITNRPPRKIVPKMNRIGWFSTAPQPAAVELPPEVWSVISSRDPNNAISLSRLNTNAAVGVYREYGEKCRQVISSNEILSYINLTKPDIFAGYLSTIHYGTGDSVTQVTTFTGQIIPKNQFSSVDRIYPNRKNIRIFCASIALGELAQFTLNNLIALRGSKAYTISSRDLYNDPATSADIFTFDANKMNLLSLDVHDIDLYSQYQILLRRGGCVARFGPAYAKNIILYRLNQLLQNASIDIISMSNTAARLWSEAIIHDLNVSQPPSVSPDAIFSNNGYSLRDRTFAPYMAYNINVIALLEQYYQNLPE